ncbi:MAG: YebC/PmpR family DNA-binding transcriptional regulator [Clostridia bacterium]
MSGHSKWANIKNKKAKGDANKAKIFTKLGREIAVAVKSGGSDPSTNSKLFDAIANAKMNNMPNDNIARGIKKAAGELGDINYENISYEGYGIAGSAIIIETLTDNKNRTAGDIRHIFDKYGGAMGTTNCVSYMFDRKGVIVCEREETMTEDSIFELVLESGAEDVSIEEDVFEAYVGQGEISAIRNIFEEKGLTLISAGMEWIPQSTMTLDGDNLIKFQKMIDAFEDNDDVQKVYHNVDLPIELDE